MRVLLELEQSALAREGLGAACEAVIELLEALAEDGASAASVLEDWRHGRSPNRAALEQVLELPEAERAALRDAVRSDIGFGEDFADPEFSFRFGSLAEATRAAADELLISIYTDVFCKGSGFRFGSGERANRKAWEESFREANPAIEICPACVSALLEPPARGRSLIDADHYLPKSKYPALAVHGLNLVPMCKTCNQSLKRSDDPLAGEGETYGLWEIWFPYVRAGITEVQLGFDPSHRESKVSFTGGPPALERALRFEQIFALLERWSKAVVSIQSALPGSLKTVMGANLDPVTIREGLEMLKRMADSDVTREVRAFLKSRYYAWLLETPEAFTALVKGLSMIG